MSNKPKPDIPPSLTSPEARLMFTDFLYFHRIKDAGRRALLLSACEDLQVIRIAEGQIKKHGDMIADDKGALRINPYRKVQMDAKKQFVTTLRALRLNPNDTPVKDNPFLSFPTKPNPDDGSPPTTPASDNPFLKYGRGNI